MLQKGKATIQAGSDSAQINFSKAFSTIPIVNISCKENVNVYLIDVTISYITVNISNILSDDLEISYVAIEKST